MEIIKVTGCKKEYLDLLLPADGQENMTDKYPGHGGMFVLADNGAKAGCAAAKESEGICELKNTAVMPDCQRRGYGKRLTEFLFLYYADCTTLPAGTGGSPDMLNFT